MLKNGVSFKSIFTVLITIALPVAMIATALATSMSENEIDNNRIEDTRDTYTVVLKTPLQLESISSASLCGRTETAPDQRICVGEFPREISDNDTVSRFERFILAEGQSCALDERGVRCWKTTGLFSKPVQKILASGDTTMVRSGSGIICLPQTDKTVVCHHSERGDWTTTKEADGSTKNLYVKKTPPNTVFGPFRDLKDFQLVDSALCALDGDEVVCQGSEELRFTPPTKKFPGAKGLGVSWDSICVLYSEGLACYKGLKENLVEFNIGEGWKNAKTLFPTGYDSICAVDDKQTPMCVNLGEKSTDVTTVTPPELTKPDVKVVKFMTSGQRKCALVEKGSEPRSLVCGNSDLEPIPNTASLVDFQMTEYVTCGVDKKGTISCFYNTVHMDSPLPEDGSKATTLGLCRWNSSRFHCSSLSHDTEFSDVRKVITATAIAETPQFPCIVYENASGTRGLRCFGGSNELRDEAPPLTAEDTKLAAGNSTGCFYGGETTRCWGSLIGNVETPNLSFAKKISFGNEFGCATDQFGFVCWGSKMDERELLVPPNMGDLDFVVDFSLGDHHVCAITREARLVCWGRNDSGQLNVPPVTNPVSIASSGDTNCVSSDEGVTCWGARSDALVKPAND